MEELTKKQLKERIGIRGDTTLRNWIQAGLIPSPVVRPSASGRGTTGYFPKGTLETCFAIRELTADGKSLPEVKAILSDRKKKQQRKQKTRRTFDLEPRTLQVLDRIAKASKRVARQLRDQKVRLSLSNKEVEFATQLAMKGKRPVALLNGSDVRVMPDTEIAAQLATENGTPAYVVIGLSDLFEEELNAANSASAAPRMSPQDHFHRVIDL